MLPAMQRNAPAFERMLLKSWWEWQRTFSGTRMPRGTKESTSSLGWLYRNCRPRLSVPSPDSFPVVEASVFSHEPRTSSNAIQSRRWRETKQTFLPPAPCPATTSPSSSTPDYLTATVPRCPEAPPQGPAPTSLSSSTATHTLSVPDAPANHFLSLFAIEWSAVGGHRVRFSSAVTSPGV